MSITISVDTGNNTIKSDNFEFRANCIAEKMPPLMGPNEDSIQMDGIWYSIVPGITSYMRDKTVNDQYYVLTMMAVVKELARLYPCDVPEVAAKRMHHVTLLVGLPPKHSDLSDKFSEYFVRGGKVQQVTYKDKSYNIIVDRCIVSYQAFAAVLTKYADLKKYPNVVVYDIGGMTVDVLGLHKGRMDRQVIDSLDRGTNVLYENIRSLCRQYNIEPSDDDINTVLTGIKEEIDLLYYDQGMIDEIDAIAERHLREILMVESKKGVRLAQCYVVFIGGGSLLLKRYIEKCPLVPHHEIIADTKANVKGYRILYTERQKRGNN